MTKQYSRTSTNGHLSEADTSCKRTLCLGPGHNAIILLHFQISTSLRRTPPVSGRGQQNTHPKQTL